MLICPNCKGTDVQERPFPKGFTYCPDCRTNLSQPEAEAEASGPIVPLSSDIRGKLSIRDMDSSDPLMCRKHFLLRIARFGARNLPANFSLFHQIYPFIALERGDNLQLEDYSVSYVNYTHEVPSVVERRARDLRIDPAIIEGKVGFNLAYLFSTRRNMRFHDALSYYLNSISTDSIDIAEVEELKAARESLEREYIWWLRKSGIPFSLKPPITIPSTNLKVLLMPFKGEADFHLGQDIPPQKLANGRGAADVPNEDSIEALIDCTIFGSAKDCVLIGSKAIYFNNGGINGFLPYAEIPEIIFCPKSNIEVDYDNFGSIDLSGSSFTSYRLSEVLSIIKREAIKLESTSNVRESHGFETLPGMSDLKQMLQDEVIEPLRDPERFKKYKIEIPNGILMYGPPGCGKTFVAQRLASELNYNFYEVSPSAVASPYIHDSVLKITKLFDDAAKNAPALMFVDEFEGMVPSRRNLGGEQQYKAEEVNEWLVQIGRCSERKIIFVAATNEPWDIDEAVQRTGRLDKKVYIGPPDLEAIEEMLLHHIDGRPFTSAKDVRNFAATIAGQGYSASDLKVLVDEAAKLAMKSHSDISSAHLTAAAVEKVPPSISHEQEELYLAFKEQRRAMRANSQ